MRILMLGWEFPPFISGGLGTACYGLTKGLDRLGHEVLFVLPRAVTPGQTSHVHLIAPQPERLGAIAVPPAAPAPGPAEAALARPAGDSTHDIAADAVAQARAGGLSDFVRARFIGVPAAMRSTYTGGQDTGASNAALRTRIRASLAELEALRAAGFDLSPDLDVDLTVPPHEAAAALARQAGSDYHGDVLGDARRYAQLVVHLCRHEHFDVIHAHDWMTYPAGMALARLSGAPLVAHIHSTEFDRSGEHVHQAVYDIERRGMHAAMRVIAVSGYTRSMCTARYGVPPDKIEVVYNGVEADAQPGDSDRINPKDKIVLFLGRITMQKGPEYFIAAARRVLEKVENVKFIVAGAGDMARRMIELAAEMGIGHKVLFTGFLRGKDVSRVFRMADCYVMPSVSEPFGIAPLEAISHDVPVIISKQSGVSEVLQHVLKVDFWDVDEMANKIVAVLRHPPLSQTLREHGALELRRLTWEGAAEKCVQVYESAIGAMSERMLSRV